MLRALNKQGPDKGRLHQDALTLGHPTPGLPRMQPRWHACYGYLMLPGWLSGKEPICQCRRRGFDPWVGKIPWRRKWQPTPVFLPGKSHGQRSLAGYSPWGSKELSTAKWRSARARTHARAHTHTHTHTCRFSHWLHYHPLLSRPLGYFSSLQESSFCAAVNSQPQGPVYRTNKSAWGRQNFPEFLAWPDQLLPEQCSACHISQFTKWLFFFFFGFSQGNFSKKVLKKINDAPTGFHGKCSPDFLNCLWESNWGWHVPVGWRTIVQPPGESFRLPDKDWNAVQKDRENIYFQPRAKILNS